MPKSCSQELWMKALNPSAKSLASTHRDAPGAIRAPDATANEWEISNSGFNGRKRRQNKRFRHRADAAEIWPGQSLVNGGCRALGSAKLSANSSF
jgi:hypothetical protein